MKACTLGILITVLCGCMLGPRYARPTLDVPATYRWQLSGASAGSYGDLNWWEIYRDPTLQALIRTAVTDNLDIRIAAARVDEARATLGSTRLAQLPQVSVDGSFVRSRTSIYETLPGFPQTGNTGTVQGNLSYNIDFWGRYARASEAARADLLTSQYAKQNIVAGLVAAVASAYFNLLSDDEELAITRRTLVTREKFVELTRAQHDRGVVTGLDVATAESELAIAQATIPDLERQIAQTEDQLSILLGKNPDAVVRAAPDSSHPITPVPPPGLPSTLLERRPDVRQAEQALVAANARVGVAKAALFPSISLTAGGGSQSSQLSQLFTGPAGIWSLGGNMLLPLLDPDRNLYQLDLANARKREAILEYQQATQNAFREVADALIAQQKYIERQGAEERQVVALRHADTIALARYKIGYASYFDVINADRDLFNAELALSDAYRNTLLSAIQLYQALGGGWQSAPSQ